MAMIWEDHTILFRGDVVYLCYPWQVLEFNNPTKLAATLMFVFTRGLVPVISATYLQPHPIELVMRRIIKRTIAKCDALLICYEDHLTYYQLLEILYAKELDIPVAILRIPK